MKTDQLTKVANIQTVLTLKSVEIVNQIVQLLKLTFQRMIEKAKLAPQRP